MTSDDAVWNFSPEEISNEQKILNLEKEVEELQEEIDILESEKIDLECELEEIEKERANFSNYNYEHLIDMYWRGLFDLKKFIRELGVDEIKKVLDKLND